MHNFTFATIKQKLIEETNISMEKVKLMCSYGGRIQPRPHDLQLSYAGGHTKILTVNHNISFSNLLSKLRDLCDCNLQIQVKYKLPGHDFEALISVFDDEDVNQMMFEYDLLRRVSNNPTRFRLFIFSPATAKPIATESLNPDFLFGFDKEYPFSYSLSSMVVEAEPSEIAESPAVNGGLEHNPGVWVRESYVYPAPLVYRAPPVTGGYFQAGMYELRAEYGGK